MWTLQDVEDEVTAGRELLRSLLADTVDPDGGACFARACRHFDRAQSLIAVVRYYERQSATTASTPPDHAKHAPTAAPEPVAPVMVVQGHQSPPAFVAPPTDVARAIGGPYQSQTIAIPSGYVRWVLRDAGGGRVSLCAKPGRALTDDMTEHKLSGLSVEGFYHYDDPTHMWEPVVALSQRADLPA